MPRAGWVKPESGRRLSDVVSVGVVTKVFPAHVVDEVIVECGRREQRHRSLPASTMTYFAIGLALHADGSYEDVLGLMADGLAWADNDRAEPLRLPSKSGISQARERLGSEPLQLLFDRVAKPLAAEKTSGCWLAGRRMVAIDGMTLDVADSDVNAAHFGRPGVNKGEQSAFPQARVVAIAECGTRAMFDAEVGPYTTAENTMAATLVG
ncbi:MAG: transposase domain-containing protein, partial [Cytophagales bacterium]|nr:transposase domain-containing protein [Cytophagales bacterium]